MCRHYVSIELIVVEMKMCVSKKVNMVWTNMERKRCVGIM